MVQLKADQPDHLLWLGLPLPTLIIVKMHNI